MRCRAARFGLVAMMGALWACGGQLSPTENGDNVTVSALSISASKLGVQILGDSGTGAEASIDSVCPKVQKYFLTDSNVAARIRAYKQRCAGGIVIVRELVPATGLGGPHFYIGNNNPSGDADTFWWNYVNQEIINSQMSTMQGYVDWLELDNELDHTDNWYQNATGANWAAQYYGRLADQAYVAGWHPLVGAIAVGNPALNSDIGNGGAIRPLFQMMKSKTYPIAWSYHSYGANKGDTDPGNWTIYRYRQMLQDNNTLGMTSYPLFITEGGLDNPGWQLQPNTSANDYMNYLKAFDSQLQRDSYVKGSTLFILSDQWNSSTNQFTFFQWQLDPIIGTLAGYIGGGGSPQCGSLAPGQALGVNQAVTSCDGRFRFVMQGDGNLVLYQGGSPLWATYTVGRGGVQTSMQTDGNLVLYTAGGQAVWSSGTWGHPGASFSMQNDGNAVIYYQGHPIWASNTCCH